MKKLHIVDLLILPDILAPLFSNLVLFRLYQQQGHKKAATIEEKDLSIQSGIYTFTQQIIKRCYRAGRLLVRICVHLNREGHATFSLPIKV